MDRSAIVEEEDEGWNANARDVDMIATTTAVAAPRSTKRLALKAVPRDILMEGNEEEGHVREDGKVSAGPKGSLIDAILDSAARNDRPLLFGFVEGRAD